MTNILAHVIVTLVTNVAVGDNAQGCATCATIRDSAARGSMILLHHNCNIFEPYKPATEKHETTTIKEVTRVEFVLNGHGFTAVKERVVSETTRKWKQEIAWKETTP